MSWYRDLKTVLAGEPETRLSYLHGQYFRRYLEQNELSRVVLKTINQHLEEKNIAARGHHHQCVVDPEIKTFKIVPGRFWRTRRCTKRRKAITGAKAGGFILKSTCTRPSLTAWKPLYTACSVTPALPVCRNVRNSRIARHHRNYHECRSAPQVKKRQRQRKMEQIKSRFRVKVAYLFGVQMRLCKVCYRGLVKNKLRLNVKEGLGILITVKRYLLA